MFSGNMQRKKEMIIVLHAVNSQESKTYVHYSNDFEENLDLLQETHALSRTIMSVAEIFLKITILSFAGIFLKKTTFVSVAGILMALLSLKGILNKTRIQR